MVNLICDGVAMGAAVVALNVLDHVEVKDFLSMLGKGEYLIVK